MAGKLCLFVLVLALKPWTIAPHQQATFGDVVGGGGGGGGGGEARDPAHDGVVEASDPLEPLQREDHVEDGEAAAAAAAAGGGAAAAPHEGSRAFHEHAKDKDHIMHDMEGVINKPESEMSQEELQFHYFKLHDSNNDNLLDGWELMYALNHDHSNDTGDKKSMSDDQISDLLDPIFREDDRNQDGFISYAEFMASIKD